MDEDQVKIPLPEDFDSFYKRRLNELIEDHPFTEMCGKLNPYTMETIYNYRDYEVCLHARLLKELYDAGGDGRINERYWKEQCAWLRMRLEQKERENSLLQKQVEEPPVRVVQEVAKPVYVEVPAKDKGKKPFVAAITALCIALAAASGFAIDRNNAYNSANYALYVANTNLQHVEAQLENNEEEQSGQETSEQSTENYDFVVEDGEPMDHIFETDENSDVTYIANKSSKKYHEPTCSSVDDMNEGNKLYWTGTGQELRDQGYDPCGLCDPGID